MLAVVSVAHIMGMSFAERPLLADPLKDHDQLEEGIVNLG